MPPGWRQLKHRLSSTRSADIPCKCVGPFSTDHLSVTICNEHRLAMSERIAYLQQVSVTAREWQTQEHMLHAAQSVRHEHMSALQIPYRQPR